jgi:predicted ATPase
MLIHKVHIEGFKSIEKLTIELGRLNVLIGENGCGKSNVLEAIAMASAAGLGKLDHEQLAARGIRTTEPRFMRSAFMADDVSRIIRIDLEHESGTSHYALQDKGTPTLSRWENVISLNAPPEFDAPVKRMIKHLRAAADSPAQAERLIALLLELEQERRYPVSSFVIYSPENTALRTFQSEAQILPLGTRGEGLFAHLKALADANPELVEAITDKLSLLDWFERLEIPADLSAAERSIRLRDRYLTAGALFDQRSANEGFLFLLFYFTLFLSPDTPPFFALDNVDASLNPRLCAVLVKELAELAKIQKKQVILTTHNPAVLDGLDLHDDQQRLFVVHRSSRGRTKVRRVMPPKPLAGEAPLKLSEAFLRGYLGGLPKSC